MCTLVHSDVGAVKKYVPLQISSLLLLLLYLFIYSFIFCFFVSCR